MRARSPRSVGGRPPSRITAQYLGVYQHQYSASASFLISNITNRTSSATMGARKRLSSGTTPTPVMSPNSINQLNFGSPACHFTAVSNWNAWIPPELKTRLPFRPMVRTPAQLGGDEWKWLHDGAFPYDMIHFYNEPERQGAAASPAAAADQWRKQMVGVLRKQKGKKLVQPERGERRQRRPLARRLHGPARQGREARLPRPALVPAPMPARPRRI